MPTDADWGRLYKFNTSGDAGLVMPFRSYYFRQFFATWQELAIGVIYRNAGNTGDNSDVLEERQSETTPANLFHFGLTNADNNAGTINVANNQYFIGLRGVLGGLSQITTDPLQLADTKFASVYEGGADVRGLAQTIPIKQGTAGDPFAMIGIRFYANPSDGLIYVRYKSQADVALADDAANTTTLAEFLASIDRTPANADAAFPIVNLTKLNAFYIFWPYLKNKMMLQTVGASRFA